MAGPYDYSINIPQPPAQNFLQSLTGIMQLRQMQEQSAIQQQQAAIQQQNAAFQQQMQPLEMEKARAGIAAAKAGTSATQTSQQAAAYQLQQRKDLDAELLGLSSDPSKFTAENLQKLAVRFHNVDPTLLVRAGEMRKNMPDQVKIFGDNIAKNLVLTSVTGDNARAIEQLDEAKKAAENTPGLKNFIPQIDNLRDSFIKNPDQTVAIAAVGQTLFAPDQGKAITDVMSEQAKIGKAKAETAGEKTKSELQEAQARLAKADATLKELKANGALDSEQKMTQENVMRSEFLANPFLRTFPIKKEAYKNIVDAEKKPIGDSAKIVAFIKLQDPGSVVSVTEKGQITSTTPIASLQALIKKFTNDGILDNKTRSDIDSQSKIIFNTAKAEYEKIQNRTALIAKRYGLNPDNIISVYDTELEQQPASTAPASGQSAEEARIRAMLRPAAGFGNTMTPSQFQPQGGTFQGTPTDVDAILKQYGPR